MTKITKTTLKSFIRKNRENLLIKRTANFDGMTDGCEPTGQRVFMPATAARGYDDYTLGIDGVWLVNGSRNHFEPFETADLHGIRCSNCCGAFTVAVAK